MNRSHSNHMQLFIYFLIDIFHIKKNVSKKHVYENTFNDSYVNYDII